MAKQLSLSDIKKIKKKNSLGHSAGAIAVQMGASLADINKALDKQLNHVKVKAKQNKCNC